VKEPADLTEIVTAVLRQAPQWIRSDLLSKDAAMRERAEEALAAMIASPIADAQKVSFLEPSRH
jgi:hypothetical protein